VKLRESEVQGGISKRLVVHGGLVKLSLNLFIFFVNGGILRIQHMYTGLFESFHVKNAHVGVIMRLQLVHFANRFC
jgi:hypothetical protein